MSTEAHELNVLYQECLNEQNIFSWYHTDGGATCMTLHLVEQFKTDKEEEKKKKSQQKAIQCNKLLELNVQPQSCSQRSASTMER